MHPGTVTETARLIGHLSARIFSNREAGGASSNPYWDAPDPDEVVSWPGPLGDLVGDQTGC